MYFQGAYNDIKDTMNEQDNLREVLKALPDTATAQVRAQKARLEAAKEVSMKEKELYKTVSYNQILAKANFADKLIETLATTFQPLF